MNPWEFRYVDVIVTFPITWSPTGFLCESIEVTKKVLLLSQQLGWRLVLFYGPPQCNIKLIVYWKTQLHHKFMCYPMIGDKERIIVFSFVYFETKKIYHLSIIRTTKTFFLVFSRIFFTSFILFSIFVFSTFTITFVRSFCKITQITVLDYLLH